LRDLKKYTSKQIIKAIQENITESRKEWMLNIFSFTGKNNNSNKDFQFWRRGYRPVALNNNEKIKQRLDYLHENPVRSGLVWEPWQYKYSGALMTIILMKKGSRLKFSTYSLNPDAIGLI
jgi:hypothetical protein